MGGEGMDLKIDHATIAGSDLRRMERAFAGIGLATDYGGLHSNNITHMALLGFDDGSYIELISTKERGLSSPWWDRHISKDGGPCAWAVEMDSVAAEAARLKDLDITVKGPVYYSRLRPDNILVEWDLAFLGDHEAGAKLPFIIKDRTPREYRVRPSPSVKSTELNGVSGVILGVEDLESSIELFRKIYYWPAPVIREDEILGARLGHFSDSPLLLASPLSRDCWLAERLDNLGESPCACLIGSRNLETTIQRLGLSEPVDWFDSRIAWLDPARLEGTRLGFSDISL
jgi:hypothetical protein